MRVIPTWCEGHRDTAEGLRSEHGDHGQWWYVIKRGRRDGVYDTTSSQGHLRRLEVQRSNMKDGNERGADMRQGFYSGAVFC